MARKRGSRARRDEHEIAERAEWITKKLGEYGAGIHRLGNPAMMLDLELPEGVRAICREFDGAELFHESIRLRSAREIRKAEEGFQVGEVFGDEVFVDESGAVWRFDRDVEELLLEGTSFDRWLAGAIDAEAVVYDLDGEFRDDVFDEDGELTDQAEIERGKRQLKRDPRAVAPKWRMARALSGSGYDAAARTLLEEVVEEGPDFPWAWFDLARISENLGSPDVASEEAEHAASVRPDYDYNVFFLAHAARLAQLAGQDERAEKLARNVLALDPSLPRHHVEAARQQIEEGDRAAARELLILAKVVAPRDLQVIDLLSQLEN